MSPAPPPRLLPSFVDRLLDTESMGGRLAGYDHRQMLAAVRADLEQLLNSRAAFNDIPPDCPETRASVLTYGLPDLTDFDPSSDGRRADLSRLVVAAINRFEPRLRRVRVHVIEGEEKKGLSVRFRVEAELNVDPAPEVGFETVLELTTGRATVTTPGGLA